MRRWLFVCSRNRLRSPTAEQLLVGRAGLEVASAGTAPDAESPLDRDMVEWADTIFVMERVHQARLRSRYPRQLRGKRVVCLDIPDRFGFMEPALVDLLQSRLEPHLRA